MGSKGNPMKTLNEKEQKVLLLALNHHQKYHNDIIAQYFFEDDKNSVVSESFESLGTINDLHNTFSGNSNLHLLRSEDLENIEVAFTRSDEIYNNGDNVIMKASLYLALIDTIKAILRKDDCT